MTHFDRRSFLLTSAGAALAAASGPGAERLHGFIPNTRIFEVMMSALGWTRDR